MINGIDQSGYDAALIKDDPLAVLEDISDCFESSGKALDQAANSV